MALSDKWTKAQLRTAARVELMDTNTRWWTDAELNNYVDQWQERVQDEFEFIWGSATITTSLSTLTLTDVATDILRVDAIYWNNLRLSYRSKEELDILDRDWRDALAINSPGPYVYYQDDDKTVSFWPPPATAGTVVFEYPKVLAFTTDTSPQSIPAWTKYSCVPYVCYRAYSRFGPNQNAGRAGRRKAQFYRYTQRIRSFQTNFFPDKYLSLRPGGAYEKDILWPEVPTTGTIVPSTFTRADHYDETPTGVVDGVNDTFTLTYDPDPDVSLALFVDGVRMYQGTHYTISGVTITFVTAYIPQVGQTVFASYRRNG